MKRKTVRYRSAITGQFVSKAYADKHPKTTVRVTIHRPLTDAGPC